MMLDVPPTLWATLGLGFVLGIRHATEADHVMAVSAMVTEHRSPRKSALVGAMWGLGHTAALLIGGLALMSLKQELPSQFAAGLETVVAIMIVGLGLGVLWRLRRGVIVHSHVHSHEGRAHAHLHVHAQGQEHLHAHHGRRAWGGRAVAMGVVHGLAGSGALAVLVMQRQHSIAGGLAFIALFGLGTVAGMMLVSGAISVPLSLAAGRYERLHAWLCGATGMASVAFGVYYGLSRWH